MFDFIERAGRFLQESTERGAVEVLFMVFDLYARDEAESKGEKLEDRFSCIGWYGHEEVTAGLEDGVDIPYYMSWIVYVFEHSVQGNEVRLKSEWDGLREIKFKQVRFLVY